MRRGILGVAAGVALAILVVEACLNGLWMAEAPSMFATKEEGRPERVASSSERAAVPYMPVHMANLAVALVVSLMVYASSRRAVG